ncbi:hypothetical protein C900_01914 [Fulvivirga imtechensis AK7]|uniref:Cytochrome c domain-containing protein n=1 Tax=Fulvivirga imtechensis AK7 TaxID=1237149 RepID=L8JWP9_9BACT|nr:hypothetical protein [Fulvivirga imtechensis]ELR72049.1 hypothetical protein C900_01914 [Fulvivirga imtechensis AK7]
MNKLLPVIFIFLLTSCANGGEQAQGSWIKGSKGEQIEAVERQFRGFDVAMVETGYRYQELYWAGKDENWKYADYQVDKLRKTIENGLERRPKRAGSAEHFLNIALPEMKQAIQKRDTAVFNKSFNMLTINCNSCHAMEKAPHFIVKEPLYRQSPIRK